MTARLNTVAVHAHFELNSVTSSWQKQNDIFQLKNCSSESNKSFSVFFSTDLVVLQAHLESIEKVVPLRLVLVQRVIGVHDGLSERV